MTTLDSNGNLSVAPDAIFTFSGGFIRPLDPDPADIRIEDIAHALSNQCRFTGHTTHFYSVGEHSILCAEICRMHPSSHGQAVLTALLHDASEAYLSDIARPVKHAEGFAEFYVEAERRLEMAIAERFGLIGPPWPEAVKVIDNGMLGREIKELMPETLAERWPDAPGWTIKPACMPPEEVEKTFLRKFLEYGGN